MVAGGALFALGNLLHPLDHSVASQASPTWVAAHLIFGIGAAIAAIGLPGICAWQAHRVGWLGIVGHVMASLGLILVLPGAYFEAFVARTVGVDMTQAIQAGGAGTFDAIGGFLFLLLGQLILAIALLRARVFPRAPAVLLILGVLDLVVSGSSESRLFGALIIAGTVVLGLAWSWLGAALLMQTRAASASVAEHTRPATDLRRAA
jgi:hypothetical protein